ncbi:MAG: NAD(P)H-dependent oxidoreductase [Candidatus Hydrogenedentes bacterium]|nr:NAD(P)H-dependent oxidoreductase [Candidatus Hydrogenedentota bacterium]
MAYTPKILAFAGSLRKESFNKRLVKIAIAGAEAAGAQVTYIDLRDFPLPVFDEDLEAAEGMPANGRAIKDIMLAHDGWLLSCPEYNSSITAVLKNTIDWASRREGNEKPLECFAGKVVSLMSASPGALGGLRGLVTVRSLLSNIQMIVLPEQVSIPGAGDAFNADGSLKDEKKQAQIRGLGENLARVLAKLKG